MSTFCKTQNAYAKKLKIISKSKNVALAYAYHESHQVSKIETSKVLGPQQGGFHNNIEGTVPVVDISLFPG
jgi:hypothetical protein